MKNAYEVMLPNGTPHRHESSGFSLPGISRLEDSQRALLRAAAASADLGLAVFEIATGLIHAVEGWIEQFDFDCDTRAIPLALWLDRIHPEDRDRVEWVLDSMLITHTAQGRVNCRLRDDNEQWHTVSLFGQLECLPDGEPARLHLCFRKTTEESIYREQLSQLVQRAESEREADRGHLARELHDELGQWLTAIRMDADRLLTLNSRGSGLSASELSERLGEIKKIAGDSIKAVQRICQGLRPFASVVLGLASTLRAAAEAFEARTGIRCQTMLPEEDPVLDSENCRVLTRAVHEALTNVARHAQASEVRIVLRQEFGMLEIEIADNGRGLPPGVLNAPSSIGLFGLRERAQSLGGEATITAASQGGTLVILRVPVRDATAKNQALHA